MKHLILVITLFVSTSLFAHDEGHGPRLVDSGKYGGLITAVILKSDSEKGAAAALVYKAELVRSANGTARVYLYDKEMKPLDITAFDVRATVKLEASTKGKHVYSDFTLERKDKLFLGKMPKPASKPYSLDVTFKADGKEFLAAFDNLD